MYREDSEGCGAQEYRGETRLNELNNDLEMFRTLPEYAALANEPRDFLESRLYEDLLEYTIYLLNESKGVTRHEEAAE